MSMRQLLKYGVRVKPARILAGFTLTPGLAGLLVLSMVLLAACRQTSFDKTTATNSLDELMQNLVLSEDVGGAGPQNPVFSVFIPEKQFEYSFASGQALAWTAGPMTKDHQFHTASVGKTFTATG
jgi:CubicO group peptidase (beta-lactamase class C family)